MLKIKGRKTCFFILYTLIYQLISAQNLQIVISNIRSNNGQIILGIFKDNETFLKEKPFQFYKLKKNSIQNGTIVAKINIAPGVYGIALLDDENNNNKMDYNFLGIPLEGFGFSNYYHSKLSKPNFNDFKFEVNENMPVTIQIKVKYI